jgi:hypothetical protein
MSGDNTLPNSVLEAEWYVRFYRILLMEEIPWIEPHRSIVSYTTTYEFWHTVKPGLHRKITIYLNPQERDFDLVTVPEFHDEPVNLDTLPWENSTRIISAFNWLNGRSDVETL